MGDIVIFPGKGGSFEGEGDGGLPKDGFEVEDVMGLYAEAPIPSGQEARREREILSEVIGRSRLTFMSGGSGTELLFDVRTQEEADVMNRWDERLSLEFNRRWDAENALLERMYGALGLEMEDVSVDAYLREAALAVQSSGLVSLKAPAVVMCARKMALADLIEGKKLKMA